MKEQPCTAEEDLPPPTTSKFSMQEGGGRKVKLELDHSHIEH